MDFCSHCRMPFLDCLSRRPEASKGLKLMSRHLSGPKKQGVCSLAWLIFLLPLMPFHSAWGRDLRGRQRTCGVTFLAACWCSVLGGLVPRLDSQAWLSGEFAQKVEVSLLLTNLIFQQVCLHPSEQWETTHPYNSCLHPGVRRELATTCCPSLREEGLTCVHSW